MLVEDFDYELPAELIAQRPLDERDASRMMFVDRASRRIEDVSFRELPKILSPGDLLVLNNTKVFPARLLGWRRGARAQPISRRNPAARDFLKGEAELFLTRRVSEDRWWGLVHPGRKLGVGEVLVFGDGELEAEILERGEYGLRLVRLYSGTGSIEEAIDRLGHTPLPPYIRRADELRDRDTYQTIFARVRGAVAAPTAGLHFTESALSEIRARGVEICEITLHVGLGTFQPVRVKKVEEHRMESEFYEISQSAANALNRALDEKRSIVAVGTTCVRTLESVIRDHGGRFAPTRGETSLFIYPGFEFRAVGALLTNFHLPKSTLLMLVSGFAGRELVLEAYRHAVRERYRFYSYGDCMLIV
jgi:S-adenosylmethionine:tRNA ribosyltransferase-isomerase